MGHEWRLTINFDLFQVVNNSASDLRIFRLLLVNLIATL